MEDKRESKWHREIGEMVLYGKTVLRYDKCFSCKNKGEYDTYSHKCYCNVTKRNGSVFRAQFCKHFIKEDYQEKEYE